MADDISKNGMNNDDKAENQNKSNSINENSSDKSKKAKKKKSLFHRIVNVFLYVVLGFCCLILLILGFTQTSTFRNILREKVIAIADSSLNGNLYIEKIDGTIFSSLILHNTIVNMKSDTLFKAKRIEVRTAPLELLFKKIYVRNVDIDGVDVRLVADSSGKLNISKLFPPTKKDTTKSHFPFTIQAADIKLTNINFSLQNIENVKSQAIYSNLNLKDFRAKDINIDLSAWADIDHNNFEVTIHKISLAPNLNNFKLTELSGVYKVDEGQIKINNMKLITSQSNLRLDADITNFNLFDSTSNFKKSNLKLLLLADKFNFADLTLFVPATKFLQGSIYTKLNIEGPYKDLNLKVLEAKYINTHLKTSGSIKNLDNVSNLYIDADFKDSYVVQEDILALLPELKIPLYKEYGTIRFNKLTYKGKIKDFKVVADIETDKGQLFADAHLNFNSSQMGYDVNYKATKLDLTPITSTTVILNSSGSVKGLGTSPAAMTAQVKINGDGTNLMGNIFSVLNLTANANNKLIDFKINAVKDTSSINFTGNFNFTDKENPTYSLNGLAKGIRIEDYTKDSTMQSAVNFKIDAEGKSFDPDRMDLFASLLVFQSRLNGKSLDSTRAIIDIRKDPNDNTGRLINLISDIADVSVTGNFTIAYLSKVVNNEIKLISSVLKEKLNQFAPSLKDSIISGNKKIASKIVKEDTTGLASGKINLKYLVEFKDFTIAALFLGSDNHLEINGGMTGSLSNAGDSLKLNYNTKIDYIKFWGPSNVFFVSKLNLDFNLKNSLQAKTLETVYADLNLKTDRVFAGTDIKNINVDLVLDKGKSSINMDAQVENYATARVRGNFNFDNNKLNLYLDTLNILYQKLQIYNKQRIEIGYSRDNIDIRNFVVGNENGEINIKGIYANSGSSDLTIKLNNLNMAYIGSTMLGLRPSNNLYAMINMDTKITGTTVSPLIDMNLTVDNVTYKKHVFGNLTSKINYANQNIQANIQFVDSTINPTQPALLITGDVPLNLSLADTSGLFMKNKSMNILVKAEQFNLSALGDVLPNIKKLRGFFNANLNITGTFDDMIPEGNISLDSAAFMAEANNLEYMINLKTGIHDEQLTVSNFTVENIGNIEDKGKMTGSGKASLKGFSTTASDFVLSGNLKLLSEESKSASLGAYGDLIVATKGNVEFIMNEDGTTIKVPILIKKANVTIPPSSSAYRNTNSAFIYKFVQDTVDTSKKTLDFESLVELSKKQGEKGEIKKSSKSTSPFNFDIDVSIENEATVHYVLNKELNQMLTAVLNGDISLTSIKGQSVAQGELKLLDGSTLEFIKTFVASGSVRFQNDITNPYLDIVATYKNYYNPTDSSSSASEIQAAVKIKIKGPVKELDKNFMQEQNNIAVYYGADNIENDVPDATKDASDAFMFIATGKFKADLSQNERSQASAQFSSTATSIAGSLLGGVLNQYLGDYVRGVELRQVGTATKFNLSGRINKFRYTVGGSTQVFQDLSQANVRIEYPLLNSLLLRVERKESINESGIYNEMINEFGIKYKFEF